MDQINTDQEQFFKLECAYYTRDYENTTVIYKFSYYKYLYTNILVHMAYFCYECISAIQFGRLMIMHILKILIQIYKLFLRNKFA